MSACPPCQRMGSLRRADSPSCGLPCDSTRSTSPMRSTDFCFPLLSTTSTRAAFVPSIFPRLAPRPFALGLHPGRRRLGDPAVQDAGFASAGGSGLSRGVSSSACSRCYRASDIPVADPWPSPRFREARFPTSQPRPCRPAVREEPPATTIQDAFHRRPAAPCAGRTHSRERSREVSASMRVPVFLRPRLRTCVRWSCELGARP
jgi:hypothetical protein